MWYGSSGQPICDADKLEEMRQVELPSSLSGRLYLSGMPGRYGSLAEDLVDAETACVTRLVCLAPRDEIEKKSPAHGDALKDGALPWAVEEFPIADYGVPDDRGRFSRFVTHLVDLLRSGERLLMHCGAGVGRTGTVAICVLMAAGCQQQEAVDAVRKAGSGPETPDQHALLQWFADGSASNKEIPL